MKKRRLSADDEALWCRVTQQTDPLTKRETFDPAAYAPPPKGPPREPRATAVKGAGRHFPSKPAPRKTSFDLVPSLPERLQKAPVQMDRKTFGKMRRGKLKPEGRIDLHGMTLDRAHGALARFILSSHGSGKRLVLVITGKGKNRDEGGPIPVRHGVLRHQVPQWLGTPPLSAVVMQVSAAHVSHGGGGAYYVYLRRPR
ncbi:Smr/MutS family protein [uncultured Roseobacter sp.]|uniref:Smr/MutS family protein n=1 Tax=uncultured Roseobacter sp. TaxID=114847 RepID=UPI002627B42E|nr:Smr/MutS family protein [uncultured Roseobacter sp.]